MTDKYIYSILAGFILIVGVMIGTAIAKEKAKPEYQRGKTCTQLCYPHAAYHHNGECYCDKQKVAP